MARAEAPSHGGGPGRGLRAPGAPSGVSGPRRGPAEARAGTPGPGAACPGLAFGVWEAAGPGTGSAAVLGVLPGASHGARTSPQGWVMPVRSLQVSRGPATAAPCPRSRRREEPSGARSPDCLVRGAARARTRRPCAPRRKPCTVRLEAGPGPGRAPFVIPGPPSRLAGTPVSSHFTDGET